MVEGNRHTHTHTRKWVQNEELIRATKLTTRKNKSGGRARYPTAEQKMHQYFKRLRGEGKSVKRYWFNQRMRQLIREHYPDTIEEFRNSNQWFARFCRRFKVSPRWKTHIHNTKTPAELQIIFRKFHIYFELEREGSMNLQILLTWIKQGHHLLLMMAKLMKQLTLKMPGVS